MGLVCSAACPADQLFSVAQDNSEDDARMLMDDLQIQEVSIEICSYLSKASLPWPCKSNFRPMSVQLLFVRPCKV